jgi:hypothetical protein
MITAWFSDPTASNQLYGMVTVAFLSAPEVRLYISPAVPASTPDITSATG